MPQTHLTFHLHDLGLIDYDYAYEAQMSIHQTVLEGEPSTILLCEHPTVITCGRLCNPKNILGTEETFFRKGVTIRNIDRGGDVTLHAPGQLVIYTIFDLNIFGKDLHRFLYLLEESTIRILAEFNIVGQRHPGHTGVWVNGQKIASMGIGVKKWVSYHGIGMNVNTDLSLFDLINPCGIKATMTSMQEVKGVAPTMEEIKAVVLENFNKVFNINI